MKKIYLFLLAIVCSVGMWGETKVYTKVTSASDLVSGSKYIFAELSTNTKYIASTTWGSSKYNSVTSGFTVSNDGNTITVTTATVLELTLGTVTVGENTYYTFNDGTYYIGKSSSNTNFQRDAELTEANDCWTITSFANGYCATSTRSGQTSRYWGRNSATFGPYNNTSSYPKAALFRLDDSLPSLKAEGGNLSNNALAFGTIETDQTSTKTFNLSAKNLTANASLAISGTDAAMFSVSPVSVTQISGTIASTSIRVEYNPTEIGDHTATLIISSTGASNVQISLSGSATAPATKYYINASAPVGGSYTVQVGEQAANNVTSADLFEAAEGQVITLTTAASTGYKLASTPFNVKKVSDESAVSVSKNGDNYTFTMPAEAVTITANYSVTYTISAGACTNGSITKIADKDGNAITANSQGSKIVVTVAPDANYVLDELYYVKEGEVTKNDFKANGYFSMVASNVTIYATFKEIIKGFEDFSLTFVGYNSTSSDSNTAYDDSDASNIFAINSAKVSSVTATQVYAARTTSGGVACGSKFAGGKAGASAELTINLATAVVAQTIVFSAAMYAENEGSEGLNVKINGEQTGKQLPLSAGNKVFEDCILTFNAPTNVSSLTIAVEGGKRIYLNKITFNVPSVDVPVSSVGYATYYNATSAFVMPEGLEGITMSLNNGVLLADHSYVEGDVVPAGEPLLIKGAATTYTLNAANTSEDKVANNLLHGNATAGTVAAVAGANLYKLLNGSNGLGWYLGAEDGGVFTLGANKAYLAVPTSAGAPAHFLFENEEQTATSIENIEATEVVKFIENGQLIIIKNGVRYNALGQVVR